MVANLSRNATLICPNLGSTLHITIPKSCQLKPLDLNFCDLIFSLLCSLQPMRTVENTIHVTLAALTLTVDSFVNT